MPISEELLTQMKSVSATDVDEASVKQLEGSPVFQAIFNKGHSTSTAQSKTVVEKAEAKVTEAEGKLASMKTEFDTFKAANPDKAAIDKQYQDKITTLEAEVTKLKADAKIEKISSVTSGAREKALSILKETVNPVHAESLVDRDAVKARILSEDGVNLRILQPGQQIPYAGDNEAQIKALAAELAKDVPAVLLVTGLPKGSGNGSSGGSGGSKKEKYDKIREESASRNKKKGLKEGELPPDPQAVLNSAFGKK